MAWGINIPDPTDTETNRLSWAGMFGVWDDGQFDIAYGFSHAVVYDLRCAMSALAWDMAVEHVAACDDRRRGRTN